MQESPTQILSIIPAALIEREGRHLVLARDNRRLLVLEDGSLIASFSVAVGMPGWETPAGEF
ncbi:MAG: L,D-transpeptidase family protein, partial [Prochlorococcus sp.]